MIVFPANFLNVKFLSIWGCSDFNYKWAVLQKRPVGAIIKKKTTTFNDNCSGLYARVHCSTETTLLTLEKEPWGTWVDGGGGEV